MPAIYTAQLAVYGALSLPTLYCFITHRRTGAFGWFYILGFCALRLAAAALESNQKNQSNGSTGTLVVENIGITPLLLGSIGILHEARVALGLTKKPKVEWVCVLFYHILVSSAVALMVVGIINLTDSTNLQHPSGSGLLKAGFSIIFVCWFLLAGWTISCCFLAHNSSAAGASSPFSTDQEPKAEEGRSAYRRRQLAAVGQSQGANNASLLIYGVLFSVPMTLLRCIYGAITLFEATSGSSSNISSNLAANVCMSVVPQILILFVYVVVGVATRNIAKVSS